MVGSQKALLADEGIVAKMVISRFRYLSTITGLPAALTQPQAIKRMNVE
ncbi:hypothetical protein PMI17_04761 [Pantoea sp. GM01]|nr:hypothetical protein PMI17_04761 [Pantoea sp. GM01]